MVVLDGIGKEIKMNIKKTIETIRYVKLMRDLLEVSLPLSVNITPNKADYLKMLDWLENMGCDIRNYPDWNRN